MALRVSHQAEELQVSSSVVDVNFVSSGPSTVPYFEPSSGSQDFPVFFRVISQISGFKLKSSSPQAEEKKTKTAMAPPPQYVKSVALKNSTLHSVKVIATFGSEEMEAAGKAKIQETCELGPQGETTLKEHEYDMGGWTAVAALFSLEIEHSEGNGLLSKTLYTPSVSGIVDLLHVDIGADTEAKSFRVAAREA
ncbi:hypothetical protein BBO99_00000543 [Phytophthora kernoviae]|uniref:Uncharacterized protein n=1 Tax=Phytophthora kernoviae TaxID=325452 RepID=A0A3R7H595_9STRA|nr:hypothetical protein JM16_000520 [Phytophthora kernoviae]KAG2533165.1 hypothetical protein JM18_000601 [Phytophthora kernoviae]RLN26039.1 hypothetical protein BBI17_000582 [Phytophthora kernoviae]RLN85414.1 hypothetical protein BBO99_00000543 [Phytophthora kernoviae]